jgi:diaminohydroxyphosphoribosylaminopyrimidine deaminase/5-amino-6-(5-phosphoribosylamino)uracil reductase
MVVNHAFYMQLALNEAWKYQALTYPNPPVGALILDKNGQILAIEAHHEAGEAHAELKACVAAVKALGNIEIEKVPSPLAQHDYLLKHFTNYFQGATIYVTLEPCMHYGKTPPCSLLLQKLGFKKVVIGTTDPNTEASGAITFLQNAGISVITPVLKESCDALIYPFRKWQENRNFIFFKLAKFQNGTISGKHVSSIESRTLVHQIRTKIDLLVIGGDTVRIDRPTLDTRLVSQKNSPDILIYSSDSKIDRTIPLFQVPDRKVFIEKSFERLKEYRHIMIEGGEGMFHHTQSIVDYYLLFTSEKFRKGKKIDLDANLKSLHCFKSSSDTIGWFKNLMKDNH